MLLRCDAWQHARVPNSRLGPASSNLYRKLHSLDAFEQATCADHRQKQIFHEIRKFVLDFKGLSADSNELKSGQIKLQMTVLSETGFLLSKARG